MALTARQLTWARENGVEPTKVKSSPRHQFKDDSVAREYEQLDEDFRRVVDGAPEGRITSAYRTPQLNAAVGGVPNSFHTKRKAVDHGLDEFTAEREAYYKKQGLQPILESDHLHVEPPSDDWKPVSLAPKALTARQKEWAKTNGVKYPGMEVEPAPVDEPNIVSKTLDRSLEGWKSLLKKKPAMDISQRPEDQFEVPGMNAEKAFKSIYAQPESQASSTPLLPKEASDVMANSLLKSVIPAKPVIDLFRKEPSQIEQGVEQSLSKNIQGFTSPESLAIAGGLATKAAPAILTAMTPSMIGHTAQSAMDAGKAIKENDPRLAAESLMDAAITGGMAAGGAKAVKNFISPNPISFKNPSAPEIFAEAAEGPKGIPEVKNDVSFGSMESKLPKTGEVPPQADMRGFDPQAYLKELQESQTQARATPKGQQLNKIYKQAKSDLVDSVSPIEDLIASSQKKHGYEILPKSDITNQIDRSLRSPTLAGKFLEDHKFTDLIKNIDDPVAFEQYLIARHGRTLSQKGVKTGRDYAKDDALVDALSEKYEPAAKEVTGYSQKLLDYSVDSGLVSKDLASKLKDEYPDYVPFKRIFNEIEKGKGFSSSKAVASLSKQSVVQKIKGSERDVESPLNSLVEKTYDAFAQGEKNKAAKTLAEYRELPGFEGLITELPKGESATHTFSYLDNGVKRTFKTTPEISTAAKSLDVQQLNVLGKILNAPVRVAKLGITGINAPFIGANIVRDQMTGFINSKHGLKTSVANPKVFLKALFNAVKHDKLYDELVRNAAGGTSFDLTRNQPVKTIEKIRSSRNLKSKIVYTVKHPSELIRGLEDIMGRSEELTRLQQFEGTRQALLKEGRTPEDANILASKAARENTANFYRKGNYGKVLNGAFLYLNAGIQGSRAFVRALERSPTKTAAKVATAIYLPVAMTTMWNLQDAKRREAYEDIEDYEKENNIILVPDNPTMNDKGQWNVIKMPLPPGISNLAIPLRRGLEQAEGLDPVKFGEITQALIGTVSPIEPEKNKILSAVTPQIIKPTLESQTNTSFFTGKPIVSNNMKRRPKDQQAYPWTSGTAKKIAKVTDSAPIQTEQFIKGTLGGVGSQALNLSDRILSKTGVIEENEVGGQDIIEAILARFNKARGGRKKRLMKEKANER